MPTTTTSTLKTNLGEAETSGICLDAADLPASRQYPSQCHCQFAALILLASFKAHLDQAVSERQVNVMLWRSEDTSSAAVLATDLQVSLC